MKYLIYGSFLFVVSFFNFCSDPLSPGDEHLHLLWTVPLSEISNSGFATYDNYLIFKTQIRAGGELYKVSKDGKEVRTAATGGCTDGIPVIDGNTIYTNNCDELYSLQGNDLTEIWKNSEFSWIPIPGVDDLYLYVTDQDLVRALDKFTGNTVWSTQINGKNAGKPEIDDSSIYFATGIDFFKDGYLYSINKRTGEINYEVLIPYIKENSQIGGSSSGVTLWRNYIYVTSTNRYIYCFNKSTGNLIWSYLADAPIEVTPAVSEDKVYFGTLNRTCYALNANTGNFIWTYQDIGSIKVQPLFYQNYVMFFEMGDIIILDKNSGKKILRMYDYENGKYGYFNAYWDTDGKIYASGYQSADQQTFLIAFQFK